MKFNHSSDIYCTLMSGQDLYCPEVEKLFTGFDETNIAVRKVPQSALLPLATAAKEHNCWSVYGEIPGRPDDFLAPYIITTDEQIISPEEAEKYWDLDMNILDYDPSNIFAELDRLVGKEFIEANVTDLV